MEISINYLPNSLHFQWKMNNYNYRQNRLSSCIISPKPIITADINCKTIIMISVESCLISAECTHKKAIKNPSTIVKNNVTDFFHPPTKYDTRPYYYTALSSRVYLHSILYTQRIRKFVEQWNFNSIEVKAMITL